MQSANTAGGLVKFAIEYKLFRSFKISITLMAQIGWIDFSPAHRQKFAAALDLLKPEGMVDELGLGTLRDGLANHLFPGLSTIHTRAKYFFIVPYILYDYEQLSKKGRTKQTPLKYLEEQEYEIMWNLRDKYLEVENSGVIGISIPRPKKIVRRPSMIYWNGINLYGFMNTGGLSAPVFLQRGTGHDLESLLANISKGDDGADDLDAEYENRFHIRFRPEKNWRDNLSMDLTQKEAEFFYHQILSVARHQMISRLLTDEKIWNIFLASAGFTPFAKAAIPKMEKGELRDALIMAHDFSVLMYGAHITYNHLLQKAAFNSHAFEEDFEQWWNNLKSEMINFESFDVNSLISFNKHTRQTTQNFLLAWWKMVNRESIDKTDRDRLVEAQEYNVKKTKARLRFKRFDEVRQDRWIGLDFLHYRFRVVKTMISDIKNGMKSHAAS